MHNICGGFRIKFLMLFKLMKAYKQLHSVDRYVGLK